VLWIQAAYGGIILVALILARVTYSRTCSVTGQPLQIA
jgi:hypothetical protein